MTVSATSSDMRPLVLIVEDSPLEAQQAARALASWYDVEVLHDGYSAIERLTTGQKIPQALVLDWVLPDLSGVDLCRFLRTSMGTQTLPILMLSSRSEAQDVIEGFAAGADDYLPKPFDASELIARVASLVRARQLLRRAEDAERALRTTLEHLPDAVLGLDPHGTVVLVNAEASRALGATGRQLVRCSIESIIPVIQRRGQEFQLSAAEFVHGERTYSVHLRSLPSESVAAAIVVLHDVTAERRAADQARDEGRRKDEFLAMLGHELRNPLAAIASASQLLRVASSDARISERAHSVLSRQIAHMVRLVDDLLDVSRITRGRIDLRREKVDVRAAVQRAAESIGGFVQSHRHTLNVSLPGDPVIVDADPTRLEQVFSNLLTNAAKYTPDGGTITVTLSVRDNEVVVSVKDTGIGIPAESLPHVFDLFTQLDRTIDRSQGGLGIGLTVVHGIVELHGGRVEAFSEGTGAGSEFRVTLPIDVDATRISRQSPTPSAPTLPRVSEQSSVRTVIVVDDHPDNAELLAEILRSAGYEVRSAHCAQDALDLAAHEPSDAVVLDIGLPDLDGFELARRLRAMSTMRDARLVALTGYGQSQDMLRSSEAGIDCHLVKPASREALFAALAAP